MVLLFLLGTTLTLDHGTRAEAVSLPLSPVGCRVHSAVGHVDLNCFFDSLLDCEVVAEALPLRINRINASTGEYVALLDEALPVDLVFILARGVISGDFKDLDEFADSKASALA